MASLARSVACPIVFSSDWQWEAILGPAVGLLIEERAPAVSPASLGLALDALEHTLTFSGALADVPLILASLPDDLAIDIERLSTRFAALMGVPAVRLRLERIETDACRKWHLDYTDLRLVVTYCGPGTQFRLSEPGPVDQVGDQHVALFKGREFGSAHSVIEHRSPPIAGTGVRRLVLVIDTPLKVQSAAIERAGP
jgi:hypothetical protein